MEPLAEILNIDYHVRRLVLKALNTSSTVQHAANRLGVSGRTLYRYIDRYGIRFDKHDRIYTTTKKHSKYEHLVR